jgi:tRNA C32,U32 (ribose-2'-O)-methylase TrmJ
MLASKQEMDSLYKHIGEFLELAGHQIEKRGPTLLLAKRIFGRTKLTVREVSTMHGVLRRAERKMKLADEELPEYPEMDAVFEDEEE